MRRETQNILLVLLGGALMKLGISGDYLRYVKGSHQVWVIAGGAIILLLGAAAIVHDLIRNSQLTKGKNHNVVGDHDHPARSAWMLLVPVLTVFLVAPPALGADSVSRSQTRAPQAATTSIFPPLPDTGVVPLSLSEFVTRAGWDSAGTLHGRTVQLTGFVVRDKNNSVQLARMVISCCAADAAPLTVQLLGNSFDGLRSDDWVSITGQLVPHTANKENGYVPDMIVNTITPVPVPQDPYEY